MPRSRSTQDGRSIVAGARRAQANGLQAARLAAASATVIGRRLALGQAAIHDPAGADPHEFVRMVTV